MFPLFRLRECLALFFKWFPNSISSSLTSVSYYIDGLVMLLNFKKEICLYLLLTKTCL
jgi:hypothetical protein